MLAIVQWFFQLPLGRCPLQARQGYWKTAHFGSDRAGQAGSHCARSVALVPAALHCRSAPRDVICITLRCTACILDQIHRPGHGCALHVHKEDCKGGAGAAIDVYSPQYEGITQEIPSQVPYRLTYAHQTNVGMVQ